MPRFVLPKLKKKGCSRKQKVQKKKSLETKNTPTEEEYKKLLTEEGKFADVQKKVASILGSLKEKKRTIAGLEMDMTEKLDLTLNELRKRKEDLNSDFESKDQIVKQKEIKRTHKHPDPNERIDQQKECPFFIKKGKVDALEKQVKDEEVNRRKTIRDIAQQVNQPNDVEDYDIIRCHIQQELSSVSEKLDNLDWDDKGKGMRDDDDELDSLKTS